MDSLYFTYPQAALDVDSESRHVDSESRRALIAAGLWMRAGFVGTSAVVIGLILLFNGEANPLLALAIALGGGAFAAFAWRRSWTILAQADAVEATSPAAAQRWDRDVVAASTEARKGDSVFASD